MKTNWPDRINHIGVYWKDIKMYELGPNKWELVLDSKTETVGIYFDKKGIKEWAEKFGSLAKEFER